MKSSLLNKIVEIPTRLPIYAIIAAFTGLLMLLLPLSALPTALRVAGILIIIYAVFRMVTVFLSSGGVILSGITLFAAIGILLLGFTLAFSPEGSAEIIATLVGIYLIIDGGIGLIKLLLQRSGSYLTLFLVEKMSRGRIILLAVLSSLTLIAGLLLTALPVSASRAGEVLCSIALIYAGGERIFYAVCEMKQKRLMEASAGKRGYIEAEFVDKTDEN